jgi:hypothetical protein
MDIRAIHIVLKRTAILTAVLFVFFPAKICFPVEDNDENEVKALFILNFIKYVNWPSEVDKESLVIGVTEESPMYNALEKIISQRSDNKKIRIERITAESSGKYQLVIISQEESGRADKWLQKFSGKGVLTVSDECVSCGSAINLKKINNKIRFEINLSGAQRGGIKISNRLIELATEVQQ